MNSSRPTKNQKTRAQAMMEFALALPILLLLLYGVLETGRYAFIRASTITAARQAVRYGSATGLAADNVTPRYNDCAGIEAAVRNVGFINTFDTITITYDGGFNPDGTIKTIPDSTPDPNYPNGPSCGEPFTPGNGDRIVVEVTTKWEPIVPILPFKPLTLISRSERTILAAVSIAVDPVDPTAGLLTLSISAFSASSGSLTTSYSYVGEGIFYTYTLSNAAPIGNDSLIGPFTVSDTFLGVAIDCSNVPTLAPGDSFECVGKGTYAIKPEDIVARYVTTNATATATGSPAPNTDAGSATIKLAELTLSKNADPTAGTEGTDIKYTFTLTNTGTVDLTIATDSVVDPKLPTVTCPAATLLPGESIDCIEHHLITAADVGEGTVVNVATAHAVIFGTTTSIDSNSDDAEVITAPLKLVIVPSSTIPSLEDPRQVITYKYTIYNNTGSDINSLSVSASKGGAVTCPTTTIPANSNITCNGQSAYIVSLAEFNAGGTIDNSATATTNIGSASDTDAVAIIQFPALSAVINVSPVQAVSPAGTVLSYTYVLTNAGNVTLSKPFSVTDSKFTFTCDLTSINPLATKTCTTTAYTVTAADETAGSIVNSGTAYAYFGAQQVQASASKTVITFSGPRFSITVSANPTSLSSAGTIVFTYRITNTGSTALTGLAISSSLGAVDCSTWDGTLAVSGYKDCTSNYVVTSSGNITNTASATSATMPALNTSFTLTVPVFFCTGNLTMTGPTTPVSVLSPQWKITNNTGASLTVTSISFTWTAGNGSCNGTACLKKVTLGTSTPYTGPDTNSGAITLNGSWNIATGATVLEMNFSKTGFDVKNLKIYFTQAGCGPLTYQ